MKTSCKKMGVGYYTLKELEVISDTWENIEDFISFYSENPPPVPLTPPSGVYVDDIAWGIVMMRVKQFQCQLFICKPNAIIPEHNHPHSDAAEVHISGMMFSKRGHAIINAERLKAISDDGLESVHGKTIKIGSKDKHNASSGPNGGAFLVFQKWHEGYSPGSLGIDWEGDAVGEEHKNMIKKQTMFDEKVH